MKYSELIDAAISSKEIFVYIKPSSNFLFFFCKASKVDFVMGLRRSLNIHGDIESGLKIDAFGYVRDAEDASGYVRDAE